MTVKEMATRLTKKLGGKPSQVSRALQHWTTIGLLSTAEGEPHQGTGRHRLYNEDALCRAAILLTLSQYGLQIKHFTIGDGNTLLCNGTKEVERIRYQ